jgi:hypothetical protein
MAHQFSTSYLADSLAILRQYKALAERAMAQVTDAQLTQMLDPESNSIATIAKHIAGNMRSRWTDFLTTDGEKPDRQRDSEFEAPPATRAELMSMWETGWEYVFRAIEPLTDADLGRTVHIRAEPHSVMQAISRQIAHYTQHIGQIVLLAKHFQSADWKSLSIPRKR